MAFTHFYLRYAGFVLCFIVFVTTMAQSQSAAFPVISEPIRITREGKEHLFASYYGINSWSRNERYATVLETDVRFRIPILTDTATLGLVDMKTYEFIPVARTNAWNLQQGCMAHWLGSNPDSVIIYNDLRDGKYVSVILNVLTRKELRVLPFPVAAVSPNGKEALSINFSRLRITREDYGYDGQGQDPHTGIEFPENDGIFLVNLTTGKTRLIVSLNTLQKYTPASSAKESLEYIGHVLFNKNGSQIFFLARSVPAWNTTAFTVNKDGSGLKRCFPDNWAGSHFDWRNENDLLVTANYNAEKNMSHVFFTAGQNNYRKLGGDKLNFDGHGTFSPDGKWMVTDTYPEPKTREQTIRLLNMKTDSVIILGSYPEPAAFTKGWRADIHCRWSPRGDLMGFNSTHSGSRQVYIFKVY